MGFPQWGQVVYSAILGFDFDHGTVFSYLNGEQDIIGHEAL